MLSAEQKEKYLASDGTRCPFCESYDATGGQIEIDGSEAWQEVKCLACEKSWIDVYKLFDVEEVKNG